MQDTWIRANEPTHKDAKAVHEQYEEFLADMKMILTTGVMSLVLFRMVGLGLRLLHTFVRLSRWN